MVLLAQHNKYKIPDKYIYETYTKYWDNKSSNTILIWIKQLTPTYLFIHIYFLFTMVRDIYI